jgi:hypothetical protein
VNRQKDAAGELTNSLTNELITSIKDLLKQGINLPMLEFNLFWI